MSQSPVNTLRRKKKLAPAPPAGAQKMSFLHSESHNVKNNNHDVIDLKQYSHYPVSEKVFCKIQSINPRLEGLTKYGALREWHAIFCPSLFQYLLRDLF